MAAATPILTVILPTRNEAACIAAAMLRLDTALSLGNIDAEVIAVDDSDDGTPQIVSAVMIERDVRVIHRPPGYRGGGLAGAVLQGLRSARGRFVVVMDADMQHPPEKIGEMLAEAEQGCDLVVASRYRRGGSAHGLGSLYRRFVSRACASLTMVLFRGRLVGLTDPLSGFFLFDRHAVDPTTLRSGGFKILLDVALRGSCKATMEVPYTFESRQTGVSKATAHQGVAFLHQLFRLKADQLRGRFPGPQAIEELATSSGADS